MANLNYVGSLAERRMRFRSTTEVVVNEKNELFNAVSIYVPASLANANIVDWDASLVSAARPAVFTCVVDNYAKIMKGALLDQWAAVFRQDTNADVILYLIVFLDGSGTENMWEIDDVSITFKPLTDAFHALFSLSFFKVLFDETHDGSPVSYPAFPGAAATELVRFTNTTAVEVTIPAGTYTLNDGVKTWTYTLAADTALLPGEFVDRLLAADSVGVDENLQDGASIPFTDVASFITPALPGGVTAVGQYSTQGIDPVQAHTGPSKYFDMALALAYLCKMNIALSWFISLVKISYVNNKPSPDDRCYLRYKSRAEQLEAMTSVAVCDRERYYWAALYLMDCTNTTVLAHAESVNIISEILAAWFASRNASGQYVGNKLSLLRLSGTRIKPLGYPSWLDSSINENDADGFDQLDAMHVGYLSTIADNTPQESALSMAHGVTGIPVTMQMIAKFVDYQCSQAVSRLVTDKGTLTNPVLTDEEAYAAIQSIVAGNLGLFANSNGRIMNIMLLFPNFSAAKVGRTAISAASAWKAWYKDDLDSVEVSGGIVAE